MTARVYVGTYAKYNSGSIAGAWLDLEDYSDAEAFAEACRALHRDEADPELMFQDFEGFPRAFYGECAIDPAVWDWLELDEADRALLAVYQDGVDGDGDFETARDRYMGRFDSEADWAADFIDCCDMLQMMPDNLRCYFDYEAYARDARLGGDVVFVRHDGYVWVFSSN